LSTNDEKEDDILRREITYSICLAFATLASAAVRADSTVAAGTAATFSGEVSPGTVTLKDRATATVESGATVTDGTFLFDGKFASLTVCPGVRLAGGGFTWGSNTGFGANAISNTVTIAGPGTTWTNAELWKQNYSQPNSARADRWTRIYLTNGVEMTTAKFGSSRLDEHFSYWYLKKARLGLTGNVQMQYGNDTTIELDGEAEISSTGNIYVNGTDNRLWLHGDKTAFNSSGDLGVGGKRSRIEFLDGATGRVASVSCCTENSSDVVFRLSGRTTRLEVDGVVACGNANSKITIENARLLVENGATLKTGGRIHWGWNELSHDDSVCLSGATLETEGLYVGGRIASNGTPYGSSGTNHVFVVSNSTLVATGYIRFSEHAVSNLLSVTDGSVVTAKALLMYGKRARVEIDNSDVTLQTTLSADSAQFGTEGEPAQIWLRGTNTTLVTTQFGNSTGTNCVGTLGFGIARTGRSTEAPFLKITGAFQNNANHLFPKTLMLRLDIDRRWAQSGTDNFIDLIDVPAPNNGNLSGFAALAAGVPADDLKGCTLEYVASSGGKANARLRLRAGPRKGFVLLIR